MKTFKKIINFFIYTVIAFIVLNILLGYFWSLRTKYKFSNYKPYSDEVLKVLKLNEKEVSVKVFSFIYQPTYIDTTSTKITAPPTLTVSKPLLFLLDPSSLTLTQKM